jgi:alpha-galactosidase/6-phospho-beta-glucosidase family protein
MAPKIAIIGGGSYQWVPKLIVDLANTPSLQGSHVVIEDINPAPIPRMVDYVEHVAKLEKLPLTASGTTDQREALDGADYVVVCISTGGFRSMREDLLIPEKYGIRQSVGDSVGPGGIIRAQRNIPIMLSIAKDMEALCPDAWMMNLTNPMSALTRSVTRETDITALGLCHEITMTTFVLSLLLDEPFMKIRPTVAGVNHLPIITAVDIDGKDGLAMLRDLVAHADERADEPLYMPFPEGMGHEKISEGGDWNKGDLLNFSRLKLELFDRFGVLPGAGDRHVAEFFPGFITEQSEFGKRWGFELTSIEGREWWQEQHIKDFEAMFAAPEVSKMPSGEIVHAIINCRLTDTLGVFPINIPNEGQVANLPEGAMVESMCSVDGAGVHAGPPVTVPGVLGGYVQRVCASQEMSVEAAVEGDRNKVLEAMLLDPFASRIDYDELVQMTGEMLDATSEWLPQFA